MFVDYRTNFYGFNTLEFYKEFILLNTKCKSLETTRRMILTEIDVSVSVIFFNTVLEFWVNFFKLIYRL